MKDQLCSLRHITKQEIKQFIISIPSIGFYKIFIKKLIKWLVWYLAVTWLVWGTFFEKMKNSWKTSFYCLGKPQKFGFSISPLLHNLLILLQLIWKNPTTFHLSFFVAWISKCLLAMLGGKTVNAWQFGKSRTTEVLSNDLANLVKRNCRLVLEDSG